MERGVEDYLAGLEGAPGAVAAVLRDLLRTIAPELGETIKWGQPVYSSGGPVCYFRAGKNHVTFGFWRGAELGKLSPRLERSGDKMAHLKLRTLDDIDEAEIRAMVCKAMELNRDKGDPSKERRTS